MSQYLPGILVAFGAFSFALLSPGPNMLAVISTAMASGRRAGLGVALGISCGSMLWGALSAIGLVSVVARYGLALSIIRICGGLYMLWLSFRATKAALSPHDLTLPHEMDRQATREHFRRGLLIQLSNPKAAMTWMAILTLSLEPDAPAWVMVTIVIAVTLMSVVAYVTYASLFSRKSVVTAYFKWRRAIELTLAVFFGVVGFRMII